jgi:16S rRNA (guanine966-N2)-methyltransferase
MRIIAGNFKGKKLFLPIDKKTRPLKDLVKESIFNLIQHSNKISIDLKKSSILDLFAGSGSFGLECLSRGAEKVIFFENYAEACKILSKNINSLSSSSKCEIFQNNCFDYFSSNKALRKKFDIVFLDPPYKELRINEIIENILKKDLLNKNGIIVIHRHKKDTIKITHKLNIFETRSYGISKLLFGN